MLELPAAARRHQRPRTYNYSAWTAPPTVGNPKRTHPEPGRHAPTHSAHAKRTRKGQGERESTIPTCREINRASVMFNPASYKTAQLRVASQIVREGGNGEKKGRSLLESEALVRGGFGVDEREKRASLESLAAYRKGEGPAPCSCVCRRKEDEKGRGRLQPIIGGQTCYRNVTDFVLV